MEHYIFSKIRYGLKKTVKCAQCPRIAQLHCHKSKENWKEVPGKWLL